MAYWADPSQLPEAQFFLSCDRPSPEWHLALKVADSLQPPLPTAIKAKDCAGSIKAASCISCGLVLARLRRSVVAICTSDRFR